MDALSIEPASTALSLSSDAEEALWTEAFWMLKEGGYGDRGARYALATASLKRKGEDIQQQLDALRLAEASLLQAARDEAAVALAARAEPRPHRDAKQARTWGQALADAVEVKTREAAAVLAKEEPPYYPTQLAQEAQQQVCEALEAHSRAEAEVQAQAVAQAEHALMLQAEAVAQAQVVAEAQAQVLSEAQAQAEAVAEMQLQLQAEAQQAAQVHEILEAAAAERNALRAQGLNSKKLPLRPGVPPCSYFMRKGECKYGKACKWDHPEALMNAKGYPKRHGEPPCAFYTRTGVCKFGPTCRFDHPEGYEALAAGNMAGEDSQVQLQTLTQALSAVASSQTSGTPGTATDDLKATEQEVQQQLLALIGQKDKLEAATATLQSLTA